MPQGLLPYKYEEEKNGSGMTALAGLPLYLDLVSALGLAESITTHMHVTKGAQGWSDEQVILSLILLNLAGGESVDDIRILEKDEGLSRVLRRVESRGGRPQEALEKRAPSLFPFSFSHIPVPRSLP